MTSIAESPALVGPVRSGGIQLVGDPNLVCGNLRIGEDLIESTRHLWVGSSLHLTLFRAPAFTVFIASSAMVIAILSASLL